MEDSVTLSINIVSTNNLDDNWDHRIMIKIYRVIVCHVRLFIYLYSFTWLILFVHNNTDMSMSTCIDTHVL